MLMKILSGLWRRAPQRVRRWGVRFTQARFTVTVGAVIFDDRERVLLLQHRFRIGSGWGIPGGFVQAGEQPLTALRRELREEISLEITAAEIAFIRTLKSWPQLEIIFRGRAHGQVAPQSFEVGRAAWFALDELPAGLSQDQRSLIARVLKGSNNEATNA
jgi:8-oxo-dGTP diphosphatase